MPTSPRSLEKPLPKGFQRAVWRAEVFFRLPRGDFFPDAWGLSRSWHFWSFIMTYESIPLLKASKARSTGPHWLGSPSAIWCLKTRQTHLPPRYTRRSWSMRGFGPALSLCALMQDSEWMKIFSADFSPKLKAWNFSRSFTCLLNGYFSSHNSIHTTVWIGWMSHWKWYKGLNRPCCTGQCGTFCLFFHILC